MPQDHTLPSGALRVLNVDDDPLNLRIVQEILSAFGHVSVTARSGAEALEHLGREAFDVVLMDIHMPDLGGVEVVRGLRSASGPERDTPVIAVTADVLSRRPREYAGLGFNGFVAKPIMVSSLMAEVQAAARSGAPARLGRAV